MKKTLLALMLLTGSAQAATTISTTLTMTSPSAVISMTGVSATAYLSNVSATNISATSIYLANHPINPQAWAKIGGFGTCSVQTGSVNIASCTHVGTGRYGISFTTPINLPIASCTATATAANSMYAYYDSSISPTSAGIVIDTATTSSANDNAAIYCNISGQ